MALASSGQLTLSEIATEYSDSAPHGMSEFYDAATGVPSSGMIAVSDFHGTSAAISVTLSSAQLNYDLYDALIAASYSSSDISNNVIFNITINSGVTMKGSSTAGSGGRVFTTSCVSGGCGSPIMVPYGGSGQRAGTSHGCLILEGLGSSKTFNVTNGGTFEAGAGGGAKGYHNGNSQNVSGGTGGSPVVMIDQDSCTLNLTNNGTMRGGGGGGCGGGWGAGHGGCCYKWGGEGQGHNVSAGGGQGGSHGGNPGGNGGGWGSSGTGQSPSVPGLGGTIVELRSCSGTSANVTNNGTFSSAGTTRSTSNNRA